MSAYEGSKMQERDEDNKRFEVTSGTNVHLANGWINVKDRMPVFGTAVLVYFKGKIPAIKISCLHAVTAKGGLFVVPDSGCKEEEFNASITHWMPLPSSPTA